MVEVIFGESPDRDLAVGLVAEPSVSLKQLDAHEDLGVAVAVVDKLCISLKKVVLPQFS